MPIVTAQRIVVAIAMIVAMCCAGSAQQPAPPAGVAAAPLDEAGLEQLAAPIALYADPLLTNILTAATYPVELVEARRWLSLAGNGSLRGNDLAQALSGQSWDPSVKALVPFPAILAMMDDHLDWTQRLGEAFLTQQAALFDAIQHLRQRAVTAGTLRSGPQDVVETQGGVVTIAPPATQIIYVPTYDPWCVYGPWPFAAYPPYVFGPWPAGCMPESYFIAWDVGLFWPWAYWEWGRIDWERHGVMLHAEHYHGYRPEFTPREPGHMEMWQHEPDHRRGLHYASPEAKHFAAPEQGRREEFRGYEMRQPAPRFERSAPVFHGMENGSAARSNAFRGMSSRGSSRGGRP
jgi:hypothetical protein